MGGKRIFESFRRLLRVGSASKSLSRWTSHFAESDKFLTDPPHSPQLQLLTSLTHSMRKICFWTIFAGVLLAGEARGEAASSENHSTDASLDLAPFGYTYHADAPTGVNPPETQWLTNGHRLQGTHPTGSTTL
jgi:hypothetical protein